MLKKTMVFAIAVVAAAAFAIPATASAAGRLTMEGTPLATGEHATLHLTGRAQFNITPVASTFGCTVHSTVTLEQHATGVATGTATFEITTNTCSGTGLLAGCELKKDSTNALFNVETTTANDFRITKGSAIEINNTFNEGCFTPGAELTFPEVTAVPDNNHAITDVTLSGEGSDMVTGLEPVDAEGTLTVEPAGTYGVE